VLRVATIVDDTEAEGPGRRFALWVQGCPIRCPGCCNPEMFDPDRGDTRSVDDVIARLTTAAANTGIEGISVLGGEPFEQAAAVARVARAARALGLTVMVYTGWTLDELRAREHGDAGIADLLAHVDLLVDGRYDRDVPEPPPPLGRRWIGSSNQTMHFLTEAYRADDPRMRAANTVEIRWTPEGLTINGWPAGAAKIPTRIRPGRS
jgi:anaerobic ribonucleoside-triphosphate reductase activating protein